MLQTMSPFPAGRWAKILESTQPIRHEIACLEALMQDISKFVGDRSMIPFAKLAQLHTELRKKLLDQILAQVEEKCES